MLKIIVDCKFHDLRHTFCSMLSEQGIDIKTASVLISYSYIKMNANIYTHISETKKKKAIDDLIF
ncbi:tyrosine-type recombinase/integrase [uncultured Tyzzerella sp.]|uniref:tyrosine-type recombinase/integrase n=1 Tax=uncultured Tyzzerella sp. TaxID=2321398 RepID=UPI0029432C31|nr:tyrosine-type recombinase/integrase [uncultured Tyzzerella sp.]